MSLNGSTLIAGLRFSVLLGWARRLPPAGPGAFWIAAALSILLDVALNLLLVDRPFAFYPDGIGDSSLWIVEALLLSWLLLVAARRPAWLWSVATWLLVMSLPMRAAFSTYLAADPEFDSEWISFDGVACFLVLYVWMQLASHRLWRWLEPGWRWRSLLFAAATALGFAAPQLLISHGLDYFYTEEEGESDEETVPQETVAAPEPINMEDLFAEQDRRVDDVLAALAPQRPGHVDLYVVALAGYASENVFANEVDYVQSLFDRRFDTAGRSLVLVNHPDTLDDIPLATLRNLRRVLAGLASRIDVEEDIVYLFLTSHGGSDHQFAMELAGLPLQQITPQSLAAATKDAGIRWRVNVISACYSGGYIDALRAPEALVMTAARSDRTSFGCGADSDITYFGRAYFTEALNQTNDFVAAFGVARTAIAARELKEDETPSEPQIASGAAIQAQLARWRAETAPGPVVSFVPRFTIDQTPSADAR